MHIVSLKIQLSAHHPVFREEGKYLNELTKLKNVNIKPDKTSGSISIEAGIDMYPKLIRNLILQVINAEDVYR